MADIKNKNELKRRIELFLDELDYSINEDFCKETMKMMREFIGHVSHRSDCEDSRVKSLKKKLKKYEDLEEQGLLYKKVFYLSNECSKPRDCGLGCDDCPSNRFEVESEIIPFNEYSDEYFTTEAEAEQKLKEMESD